MTDVTQQPAISVSLIAGLALASTIDNSFSFRKDKETGVKRDSVSLKIQVPTAAGIAMELAKNDAKISSYLEDLVAGAIFGQVRIDVDADTAYDQAKYDANIGKYTIEAIANLPKAERNIVTKEDLEAFATSYVAIMPAATGLDASKVQLAAGLFVTRFAKVSGDNEVLTVLQTMLSKYMEVADAATLEAQERVLTYFTSKLEELLSVKISASALM